MTEGEQKTIEWIKNAKVVAEIMLKTMKNEPDAGTFLYEKRKERTEIIIKVFEELEQYRAIGTIEECKEAVRQQQAAIKKENKNE